MRGSALSAARAIAARNFDDSDDDSGDDDDDDENSRLLSDDEQASYYRQLSPPKRPSFLPVIHTEGPRTPSTKVKSETSISPLPTPKSPARTPLYDDENKKMNRGVSSPSSEVKVLLSPQLSRHSTKEHLDSQLRSPAKNAPALTKDQPQQRRSSVLAASPTHYAPMRKDEQRKQKSETHLPTSARSEQSIGRDDPKLTVAVPILQATDSSVASDQTKTPAKEIPSLADDQRMKQQTFLVQKSPAENKNALTSSDSHRKQQVAAAAPISPAPTEILISTDDHSKEKVAAEPMSRAKELSAEKDQITSLGKEVTSLTDDQRKEEEAIPEEISPALDSPTSTDDQHTQQKTDAAPISQEPAETSISADDHSTQEVTSAPTLIPEEISPAMDSQDSTDDQHKQQTTDAALISQAPADILISADDNSKQGVASAPVPQAKDALAEKDQFKLLVKEIPSPTDDQRKEEEAIPKEISQAKNSTDDQHKQQKTAAEPSSQGPAETSISAGEYSIQEVTSAPMLQAKDPSAEKDEITSPAKEICSPTEDQRDEQETFHTQKSPAGEDALTTMDDQHRQQETAAAPIVTSSAEASISTDNISRQETAPAPMFQEKTQPVDIEGMSQRTALAAEVPKTESSLSRDVSDIRRQSAAQTKELSAECSQVMTMQNVNGNAETQLSLEVDSPKTSTSHNAGRKEPEAFGPKPLTTRADQVKAQQTVPAPSTSLAKELEMPPMDVPVRTESMGKAKGLPKTVSWSQGVNPPKCTEELEEEKGVGEAQTAKLPVVIVESQNEEQRNECVPNPPLTPPPSNDEFRKEDGPTSSTSPTGAPSGSKDSVRSKANEISATADTIETKSPTSALAGQTESVQSNQHVHGRKHAEETGQTVPDEVLRTAKSWSEMLEARVREEEERIEKQQKRMMELEREAVARESMVAAAEAKALDEMKRLKELEARESEELDAIAAARRAKHALRLRELEEEEERRVRNAAVSRRLATEAKLMEIQAESARTIENAEKQRRASATRLRDIEDQNAALQRRYEDLEKERARKEAEVSAAELRNATHNIGPTKSLYDVLEMIDDDELSEGEEPMENEEQTLMPEPHSAAASGLLSKLKALSNEALLSKDAAERTPLFYACAHGHDECVELIVRRVPEAASMADANGDTPLHAAVSAGASVCAKLVVDASHGVALVPNCLGMHAAHLAANVDCIEVLLQAGASFVVQDSQMRTPLFVACAMNRFECATFLLELIDLEPNGHDSLSASDARGDTTLHAAACNGAEACVRLLLESGVRCDICNHHGLRPVDLAAKRGHTNCRRLLAEYQLHHSTTASHFDSVLFLATIEGHRQCKAQLQQEPFRIIRRRESAQGEEEEEDERDLLERKESRYSLRRGRSMKVAQWGSWIAYEDTENNGVYWYNQLSGKGQWTKPEAVHAAQTSQDYSSKWESMRTNSMRLAQVGEWIQYREKGCSEPFYYHPHTGDFSWERPSDLSSSLANPTHDSRRHHQVTTRASTTPWTKHTDAESGKSFWYNRVSQVSQWDPPEGIDDYRPERPIRGNYFSTTTGNPQEDEGGGGNGAAVIENVNDLGI